MRFRILTFIVVILLFSCNDTSNNEIELEETKTNKSLKITLLKSLNLSNQVNKILFVPDNSCKGCLKYTKDNCEKLSAINNLEIYYFNELNFNLNECTMRHQSKKFKIDYSNYDIYGITLFELMKDSIRITYIDATNIDSIYNILLN